MISVKSETRLSPEEVVKRAVVFFGPGGLGLAIKDQGPTYALLEGGGGHVEIRSSPLKKGASVEFVSQEWEIQVKKFIDTLKR